MGAVKQRLIIDMEMDNEGEVDIMYILDPKTSEIPEEGPERELHLLALTCCDIVYKGMKELMK
jgi:hypothetical protein